MPRQDSPIEHGVVAEKSDLAPVNGQQDHLHTQHVTGEPLGWVVVDLELAVVEPPFPRGDSSFVAVQPSKGSGSTAPSPAKYRCSQIVLVEALG
jgi:hypothetical protein